MFDDSITGLLDQLIPSRQFIRRPRPSDPWFDRECRDAKRLTRRLRQIHANAVRNVALLCVYQPSRHLLINRRQPCLFPCHRLRSPGVINVAAIVNYSIESAVHTGRAELRLIALHRNDSGDRLTLFWAVVVNQQVMLSASMNSAATLTIKLTLYVNLLKVHPNRFFLSYRPAVIYSNDLLLSVLMTLQH